MQRTIAVSILMIIVIIVIILMSIKFLTLIVFLIFYDSHYCDCQILIIARRI